MTLFALESREHTGSWEEGYDEVAFLNHHKQFTGVCGRDARIGYSFWVWEKHIRCHGLK